MSVDAWTEAPLFCAVEKEVLMLVSAVPRFTPRAARETASEMVRVADEVEASGGKAFAPPSVASHAEEPSLQRQPAILLTP